MKIFNVKGNSFYSLNVAAESAEEAIKSVLLRDTEGQLPTDLEGKPRVDLEQKSDTEFLFRCGNFRTIMSASEITFILPRNAERRS